MRCTVDVLCPRTSFASMTCQATVPSAEFAKCCTVARRRAVLVDLRPPHKYYTPASSSHLISHAATSRPHYRFLIVPIALLLRLLFSSLLLRAFLAIAMATPTPATSQQVNAVFDQWATAMQAWGQSSHVAIAPRQLLTNMGQLPPRYRFTVPHVLVSCLLCVCVVMRRCRLVHAALVCRRRVLIPDAPALSDSQ